MNNGVKKEGLFNLIAPVYGLFFARQQKRFSAVLDSIQDVIGLSCAKSILDVGCGTGALCDLFSKRGLAVTGIDPAQKMLDIARKKLSDSTITFIQASALHPLPFAPKSFDISIASYVAHGLSANERETMYAHMSNVTKRLVIIYDYNTRRSVLTSAIELLEGGDYFNFIKHAREELENQFCDIHVVDVDAHAAWYICTPNAEV